MALGSRNSGMPYISTPPATCSASKMVTLWPKRARSAAAGQAGRAGADDGHLLAGGRGRLTGVAARLCSQLPVGHVALQAADGHGRALLGQHADLLALGLLRADAAADGGQVVLALQDLDGRGHVARRAAALMNSGMSHLHRAALAAGGLLALEAALGLGHGLLGV